jgi:Uma2 family endonuclease
MIQAVPRLLSFEEFLDFDDGTELNEYELVDGRLVLMPEPDDWHEAIAAFLDFMFQLSARDAGLPLTTRKRTALYLQEAYGRRPDVAVIDKPKSYMGKRGIYTTPYMIVEIASSNWSTDLVEKLEEYEKLGVTEYWIVDYRGQISARWSQREKRPKVIVLSLENGEYRRGEFIGDEVVPCLTFPALKLTVKQILEAN